MTCRPGSHGRDRSDGRGSDESIRISQPSQGSFRGWPPKVKKLRTRLVGCLRNSQQNFGETSPDYALVTAIEGRASRAKAMSLCLGAACKLSYWSECLGKMRAPSQAPKTALKLFVPFDPAQGRPVPSLLQLIPRSTQCRSFSSDHE